MATMGSGWRGLMNVCMQETNVQVAKRAAAVRAQLAARAFLPRAVRAIIAVEAVVDHD